MPRVLALLLAAALASLALPAAPAVGAGHARLKAFENCAAVTAYGRRHARRWTPAEPRPLVRPVPGPLSDTPTAGGDGATTTAPDPAASRTEDSGEAFSLTNNQETGVFEADSVKTDGRFVYTVARGRLQVVDTGSGAPVRVGSLALAGDGYDPRLLLRGTHLLVLGQRSAPAASAATSIAVQTSQTVLEQVDVSDPAHPVLLRTVTLDGSLLAARRIGPHARLVLQSRPRAELRPDADPARVRAWLPRARFANARTGRKRSRLLVRCNAVRRPRTFSGLESTTVLTLDLDAGLDPVDADTVLATGDTVYASATSLFVASRRYQPAVADRTSGAAPRTTTQIHRFDIGEPSRTTYRGSGEVPGYLLGQFAMSDRAGVLRVASTTTPPWFEDDPDDGDRDESVLTTLALGADAMTPLGSVGGLGKGERIYAVRFLDTAAFVVTFRQVDPLYAIDLTDPARPAVAGELKLRGYSAYLHPAGPGRLIGVGQDATEQGRTTGTQVSLFDVSDLAAPKLLQQARVGDGATSPVEDDHLAFLYWPRRDLVVFPLDTYADRGSPFTGAIAFTVRDDGIAEAGRVAHPDSVRIEREIVIGDTLYTASQAGLRGTRLDGWGDAGYAAF